MAEIRKREPAFYTTCQDLLEGEFVKTEGWDPNYVKTKEGLLVSRATITGTVLECDEQSLTLDDTTGIISVRTFEPFLPFAKIKTGDYILLIGKIRQYNGEVYITPEICTIVDNEWNTYFKKQSEYVLELYKKGLIKQEESKPAPEFSTGTQIIEEKITIPENNQINYLEKVITFIDSNDSGQGVEKVKILEDFSDVEEITDILDSLIMEGDIFELKPGMFKVLK